MPLKTHPVGTPDAEMDGTFSNAPNGVRQTRSAGETDLNLPHFPSGAPKRPSCEGNEPQSAPFPKWRTIAPRQQRNTCLNLQTRPEAGNGPRPAPYTKWGTMAPVPRRETGLGLPRPPNKAAKRPGRRPCPSKRTPWHARQGAGRRSPTISSRHAQKAPPSLGRNVSASKGWGLSTGCFIKATRARAATTQRAKRGSAGV